MKDFIIIPIGGGCPHCGERNDIRYKSCICDEGEQLQEVSCLRCSTEWMDIYKYSKSKLIKVGRSFYKTYSKGSNYDETIFSPNKSFLNSVFSKD